MVEVTIEAGIAKFELKGLHKLWAVKGCVYVPVKNIKYVRHDPTAMKGLWKGWRVPGTHIPGVIIAGTYHGRGKKCFWDVSKREKTIIVEIEGGPYDKVIVDVEDPKKVVSTLKAASDKGAR